MIVQLVVEPMEHYTALLQVEKDELQAALEEAESALEQEENKVVRAGLELQQVVVAFNDNDNLHPLLSFNQR